jgi:thiol-disulfide isomerase/thioredoxin
MQTSVQLPVEGQLASFEGASGWLNTPPLTPASLRGHPVLVEFWTFTCINWIRTLPYVRSWSERYRKDGLIVVGVHTPEFRVEHDLENIRRAVEAMRIDYPVAIDNDYAVWAAFGNQYWPALYFADAEGQIRYHHFGEGEYDRSEIVIQLLLADAGAGPISRDLAPIGADGIEAPADWEDLGSPETYLGYGRAETFASPGGAMRNQRHEYALPDQLPLNHWGLEGEWTIGREAAVSDGAGGHIAHRFHARDLHLVLAPTSGGSPVRFRVELDGRPPDGARGIDVDEAGQGAVTEPRLYQLIRQQAPIDEHTFEITFLDPGARAYVFTFG